MIKKFYCSQDGVFFKMTIKDTTTPYTRFQIEYDGDISNIMKRLEAYGEKNVHLNGGILSFKEIKRIDERIFNKGEVRFLLLLSSKNGSIKDPIDTLFTYNPKSVINLKYHDVEKIFDQRGRPTIIISIEDNIEGYIGLLVDGNLVSCGISKKMIYFPFNKDEDRDLYYSMIKSGELKGKIKKIRRLK